MNIDSFKEKVLDIATEAEKLTDSVDNQEKLTRLQDLTESLNFLVEFVNDELNISVLKNYYAKDNKSSEKCPLDGVCQSVVDKLKEIESLLRSSVFDFTRLNPMQFEDQRRIVSSNQDFNNLNKKLKDKSFLNLLNAYKVLKHLDGHRKTLIILGPNGSGKTSFANYLKRFDAHVKVIPASKPIIAIGHIPNMYNTSLDVYNNELYSGGIPSHELLQKLIVGMCNEHDDIARVYMDTRKKNRKSTYEKVKEIFDDYFEVSLDNTSFSVKEIKARKGNGIPFHFNNMSDGERGAFFYIATVIAAPEQSFIIVDEPENHLNPAIYNKIWERLINDRKDCQFIFISHNIEFISARSNFEVAKVKNFVYPDKFEFDFLGDTMEDIPSNLVVEILGSRKPILFCEGEKVDYDYKVYECLFGDDFTIVPVGNCTSVERCVVACNLHANTYNAQSAIGIIDSDLKSEVEIEKLKENRIFTLRCNEIEMLLIDEMIFKEALARVFKSVDQFYVFEKDFFTKLDERRDFIIKRLVKTQIDEILQHSVIDDKTNKTKEAMKANLETIIKKIDVDRLWQEYESNLTDIISHNKYEEALRICCLEHGEIISGLGNKIIPNYRSIALGVLRDNTQLAKAIRDKYFGDSVISK